MRTQLSLLALPALALAADQQPLGAYFQSLVDKVTSYIPTSIPNPSNPVNAATAKVAELATQPLTLGNWKEVLRPGPPTKTGEPDEWLVYITGGNTSCYGRCANATAAWNTGVTLLSALPSAPKMAQLDCETDGVLCSLWSAHPPSIYHMLFPHGGSAAPTVRFIPLNTTTVTSADIVEIHTKRTFESTEPYTGIFHPFDSILVQTGLDLPLAYFRWGLAKLPSWAPMVLVSLLSRSFTRRMPQGGAPQGGAPAPAR